MDVMKESVDRLEDLSPHEQRNVIATLKELVSTQSDAADGYETVATQVNDAGLASLLVTYGARRRLFCEQLQRLLGEAAPSAPLVERSPLGKLHRHLIEMRGKVEHMHAIAALSECERGERVALMRYERALKQRLPMPIAVVLLDQIEEIRDARHDFDRMRHPW